MNNAVAATKQKATQLDVDVNILAASTTAALETKHNSMDASDPSRTHIQTMLATTATLKCCALEQIKQHMERVGVLAAEALISEHNG